MTTTALPTPKGAMPAQPALPSYHIRPAAGWLNDPNGMTYRDGRWHVFYQHNPASAEHGDIHWAHVSSDDLVTWREHPVAFGPQPGGPDRFGCWSGVVVPELPGLPSPDGVLAAYSGVVDESAASTTVLRRALDDDLETWSPPWTVATTPQVAGVAVMRDPVVFAFGGRRWALHGAGLHDGSPAVLLYACDDLDAWTYEGLWFTGRDAPAELGGRFPADIWECPQLALVDGRAVLVLSTQHEGRLEDVVAVVGDVVDDPAAPGRPAFAAAGFERLDLGDACYAPQFATDPDGSWHLGWVRQDGVPPHTAPGEDLVAGCLTLPRRLAVAGDRIVVTLDPRVRALLGAGRELPAGEHALPAAAMVATTGGTLHHAGGEIALPDAPVEVWLDGEVVEVYPVSAVAGSATGPSASAPRVPATYRRVDTTQWRLDVPAGATLHAILRSPAAD